MYISQIKVDGMPYKLYKCKVNYISSDICILNKDHLYAKIDNVQITYSTDKTITILDGTIFDDDKIYMISRNIKVLMDLMKSNGDLFYTDSSYMLREQVNFIYNLYTKLAIKPIERYSDLEMIFMNRVCYDRFKPCILLITDLSHYRHIFSKKGTYMFLSGFFLNDQFIYNELTNQ